MSERHLFLAFTNAVAGREDDFNRWYDEHHVREVVGNAPGFVAGRRFVLDPQQRVGQGVGDEARWKYLAVYELETSDVAETHAALAHHSQTVGWTGHDGALASDDVAWVYTPIGERHTGGTSIGEDEHVFLAFTNSAQGRDDDLNAWYDNYHLGEILAFMPGFVTGMRYEARPANQRPGQSPPWTYLALYDLEGDLGEIHEGDAAVRSEGTLTPANGAFEASFGVWVYTPVGPWVTKAELEAVGT